MKPTITIEYCTGCRWLLRASWNAQELLTTFESDLKGVTLTPSGAGGIYIISVDDKIIWDRKENGCFPEMKELKQLVRDCIAPDKDLGHSDAN
ncbi:MAG: selenoprotein W-related protein [Rubritalea sp.]|jgi:selenoprotein W-related protein